MGNKDRKTDKPKHRKSDLPKNVEELEALVEAEEDRNREARKAARTGDYSGAQIQGPHITP